MDSTIRSDLINDHRNDRRRPDLMQWQPLGPLVPRRNNPITCALGRLGMRILGWRMQGTWPNEPKLIVAVAPHSSNMDFILSVAVFWALNLKTSYLAKKSLFWFPLGIIMRALGGIPVDRTSPAGMVDDLAERYRTAEQLVIGITPEGTRGGVSTWKSGFARIAAKARVPVLPAIVNYEQKIVYLQPVVSGDGSAEDILTATRLAASVGCPKRR
jgi:1-acyl-sn-glycerol-3-phosphate acyltransferase